MRDRTSCNRQALHCLECFQRFIKLRHTLVALAAAEQSAMFAASVKLMYAPQPQPRQIQALSQFTVTKVACGQNHTLALTKEGQAFTWGKYPDSVPRGRTAQQHNSNSASMHAHVTAKGLMLHCCSKQAASFADLIELQYHVGQSSWRHGVACVFADCCLVHGASLYPDHIERLCNAGNGGYGRLGHVKQQDEFKPRNVETFSQRVPVAPDVVSVVSARRHVADACLDPLAVTVICYCGSL